MWLNLIIVASSLIWACKLYPNITAVLSLSSPDIQIDQLDVTNEENVRSIIKKYTTQSDSSKNLNTLFNCAGSVAQSASVYCHVYQIRWWYLFPPIVLSIMVELMILPLLIGTCLSILMSRVCSS